MLSLYPSKSCLFMKIFIEYTFLLFRSNCTRFCIIFTKSNLTTLKYVSICWFKEFQHLHNVGQVEAYSRPSYGQVGLQIYFKQCMYILDNMEHVGDFCYKQHWVLFMRKRYRVKPVNKGHPKEIQHMVFIDKWC